MKSYCPVCRTYEVWDNARYCSSCGAELVESPPVLECGACHREVKAFHKYCVYCGVEFKKEE